MIEAGFDILNPVQCSAAGMEPARLKAEFGDQIVFWGGGVDTQRTLLFGTPAEIREQVLRRCEIFAPGADLKSRKLSPAAWTRKNPNYSPLSETLGGVSAAALTISSRSLLRSEEHTSELQSLRHLV